MEQPARDIAGLTIFSYQGSLLNLDDMLTL